MDRLQRQNVAMARNGQSTFTSASTAPVSGRVTQDDASADSLLGGAATVTQDEPWLKHVWAGDLRDRSTRS